MPDAANIRPNPTTFADLLWPAGAKRSASLLRAVALLLVGAVVMTLCAKVRVPGPVPLTLQSLGALVIGAALGLRLALGAVLVYLAAGGLGLPVFAGTPPVAAGLAYLAGPTGGFLVGLAAAAAVVGLAADRGLIGRPLVFALALVVADAMIVGCGFAWLAGPPPATGLGAQKAFTLGVQPFLLAEALKVALAAVSVPVVWDATARLVRC